MLRTHCAQQGWAAVAVCWRVTKMCIGAVKLMRQACPSSFVRFADASLQRRGFFRLRRRLLVLPCPARLLLDGLLVRRPVEDVVHLVALLDKEIPEELPQVLVVRLVLEPERPRVVQVRRELTREALAQRLHRGGHLLLADPVVLLLLRLRLQALPRQAATQEVHQHVAHSLEVVPPALLNADVRVDRRVPRRARQVLALLVRDVLVRLRVAVLLRQTEVDHVHVVSLLRHTHQEVVGLDVTVKEVLGVRELDTRDHLVGEHQGGLDTELPVHEVEQVFEGGAEKVDNHDVVVALHAVPVHLRDADGRGAAVQDLVQTGLVEELRVPGFHRLKLDRHRLAGLDVGSLVDVTERPSSYLPADAVLVPHTEIHRG
eukprot:Rhum_TRINITY_DN14846_c4_g1::Rhum_TRINITY_DN14846_c4_g1_i4::g.122834::m.122834